MFNILYYDKNLYVQCTSYSISIRKINLLFKAKKITIFFLGGGMSSWAYVNITDNSNF